VSIWHQRYVKIMLTWKMVLFLVGYKTMQRTYMSISVDTVNGCVMT